MVKKKSTNKKVAEQKTIKTVTLTREQILTFLDFEEKEAGEFIIAIARYVSDGKFPTFKERFKNLFFKSTFGNSLERQLQNYDAKATLCMTNAERRKTIVEDPPADMVENDIDSTVGDDSNEDANAEPTVSLNATDVVPEDISFAGFIALYGKKDARDLGTESLWNEKSDDEKRKILSHVRERIVPLVDVTKREYPFAFLRGNAWK